MRILVTNDDGIHSEGLDVCAEIGRALSDDVWVVAPESDQSGVSHSLSLNDPLRLREVGERRFAVKGTPTDCVIMGARHILKDRPPDLVLSGVNRGRNAGEDVIYSGTVAGAVEGTILGIPSFALSQAYMSRSAQPPHWDTAVKHGARHHPPRAQGRHSARRADQHQLPQLPARRGEGHRGGAAGPQQDRSGCRSKAARTAAAIPITGSCMCASAASRRSTAPTSPRSPTIASR